MFYFTCDRSLRELDKIADTFCGFAFDLFILLFCSRSPRCSSTVTLVQARRQRSPGDHQLISE